MDLGLHLIEPKPHHHDIHNQKVVIMTNVLLNSVNFIEMGCLIIGISCFKKYRKSPTKWILPYLFFVVAIESIGWYMRTLELNNGILYNLLAAIELFTMCYIFSQFENVENRMNWYMIAFFLGVIALLIDGFFMSAGGFSYFLNYGISICDIIVGFLSLYLITHIVRTEKVLHLHKILIFWVSVGLLIFHFCSIPITVISNIYQEISPSTNRLLLLQTLCSIIMYICFSIGFIWSEEKYNF